MGAANMLADDRFGAMFTDENFQVDENDLTYKLLNPVLSKLDNKKAKQLENKYSNPDISDDENDKNDSDDFDDDGDDSSESSDDDAETTKNIRQAHKNVREEVFEKKMEERSKKIKRQIGKTIVKSSDTNQSSQNHHKIRELDEDEMKNDGNGI